MLCAAWERYNEDLLLESIQYLTIKVDDINSLNKTIKKTISNRVKSDSNEIKPIELAGIGWKEVWISYARQETELLNTPKSDRLETLFNKYLGLPAYTSFWKTQNPGEIDSFVSDRGEIAHNGNKATYITMTKLRKYQDLVIENVIEIDSKMADELKRMASELELPWMKHYSKELRNYK